jgi:hypothetical protein
LQPWPQGWLPKTLLGPSVVESRHMPPQHGQGLTVVAQVIIDLTQHEIRHDLEGDVPRGGGEVQDPAAGGKGVCKVAFLPQIVRDQ